MAPQTESSHSLLLPNSLYRASGITSNFARSITKEKPLMMMNNSSSPSLSSSSSLSPSPLPHRDSITISAPSEPGKIAMYSPQFYAACTVGGILSCGLTHMAVTPLDLVKCNMQVSSMLCFLVFLSLSMDMDMEISMPPQGSHH